MCGEEQSPAKGTANAKGLRYQGACVFEGGSGGQVSVNEQVQ